MKAPARAAGLAVAVAGLLASSGAYALPSAASLVPAPQWLIAPQPIAEPMEIAADRPIEPGVAWAPWRLDGPLTPRAPVLRLFGFDVGAR